jgi:uncharacterized protein DUF2721
MPEETRLTAVAHVIQLAVAPVFLLSAIGAMLAVLTNRLGRVIDSARALEARLAANASEEESIHSRLGILSRRAKLTGRSIALCTITALLVCTVIVVLFLAAFLRFDASLLVALLFVAGMITFFAGLLTFLREIFLATRHLRIGAN